MSTKPDHNWSGFFMLKSVSGKNFPSSKPEPYPLTFQGKHIPA
ncbi:hypothetical protein RKD52_002838 [Metabacillus sp. SLBN-84]